MFENIFFFNEKMGLSKFEDDKMLFNWQIMKEFCVRHTIFLAHYDSQYVGVFYGRGPLLFWYFQSPIILGRPPPLYNILRSCNPQLIWEN